MFKPFAGVCCLAASRLEAGWEQTCVQSTLLPKLAPPAWYKVGILLGVLVSLVCGCTPASRYLGGVQAVSTTIYHTTEIIEQGLMVSLGVKGLEG